MIDNAAPSKHRQDVPCGDIHAQIAKEVAQLKKLEKPRVQDAARTPALNDLMGSAREALERAIPSSFEHEGKTYYLRVSVGLARLIVFDTPTAPEPLVFAMSGSHEEFGHTPRH